MKSFRNIRVIPVVVIAIASLAALKVAGLLIDGAYVFDYRLQGTTNAETRGESRNESRGETKGESRGSWAQQMLKFPGGPKAEPSDVTGSMHGAPKEEAPKPAVPETKPDGVVIHPEDSAKTVSPSERAILERLQSRRQELETRAREIDIRENLLKAAEKRIESKVEELKAIESRAATEKEQKAEAENTRLKGLVTTYESMKPKDAAKVFEAGNAGPDRDRLPDRPAQDVGYHGADATGCRRTAHRRACASRRRRQVRRRHGRPAEDRRQSPAAAKVRLRTAYLTSP